MRSKAVKSAEKARLDSNNVIVTDMEEYGNGTDTVTYFIISQDYDDHDTESYAIYQIGADIYYRNAEEFYQILEDFKDEISKCSKCGLCQSVCPIYKLTGNDCAVSRGKFVI